ncbi:hypothetical protein ACJJTC_015951 [Scirpophaga incertulas]
MVNTNLLCGFLCVHLCCPVFEDALEFVFNFFVGKMSGDTDKAKISDNQDEDKKSGAGDDHSTEDESSQDSKGESLVSKSEAQGTADVDQLNKDEKSELEGDVKPATANGSKDDPADEDSKVDIKQDKVEVDKKEENGETHDDEEKEDVKGNDKAAIKPAPKKKAVKREDSDEEDEDEEEDEEDDDEDGDGDDADEKDKEKPKKPVKKAKEDDEDADEEGDEEGEEEEEEEEEEAPKPKPKKEPTEPPVPLPAGKGIPLGHISNVEVSLSRFKTQDQKILHQYLYGQLCLDRNVKRNIKKFKGYEWAIGSSEYKAKLEETAKMDMKQLRTMCEMLDLDKKGGASELSSRLVGFLHQPSQNSPHARGQAQVRAAPQASATPGGRPRRSVAVKVHNRGYSDDEYETDPDNKVRGPKPVKDGSEDSDGSFNPSGSEEGDSDFDPEAGEGVAGPGRKRKSTSRRRSSARPSKRGRRSKGKKGKTPGKPGRGRRAKSESEEESEKSESESENESGSEGEESDDQKAKRGRPAAAVAKGRKGPVAKAGNAKATPVKRKAPEPSSKKKPGKPVGRPAKKSKKVSSDEESGSEEEDGSEEDESGDDSDSPADKKKRPPTDDEIKKYVKHILEGANLEQITMKTVCKQVYSHYPDFDLAHKKDFIKATVKSCI